MRHARYQEGVRCPDDGLMRDCGLSWGPCMLVLSGAELGEQRALPGSLQAWACPSSAPCYLGDVALHLSLAAWVSSLTKRRGGSYLGSSVCMAPSTVPGIEAQEGHLLPSS